MKPAPFDYVRPAGLEEAVFVLGAAGGDARILAGGLSLVPMMNFRVVAPAVVVDIGGLGELRRIADEGSEIEIGAGVAQASLERWPDLARRLPLLAEALPHVGHYPTRARGTVGGSVAHADPSAELPLVLALLDGTVRLRSASGERLAPARGFYKGPLETACGEDEMVVATRWPSAAPGARYAFDEVALRHGDFAIASCAVLLDDGRMSIGFGGVAEVPVVREWPRLTGSALDDALAALAEEIDVVDDGDGGAAYRRGLVRSLGRRTVDRALAGPPPAGGADGGAGRLPARPAPPGTVERGAPALPSSFPPSPSPPPSSPLPLSLPVPASAPWRPRTPPRRVRAERCAVRCGGAAAPAPQRLPSSPLRPPGRARRVRARGVRGVHRASGRSAGPGLSSSSRSRCTDGAWTPWRGSPVRTARPRRSRRRSAGTMRSSADTALRVS